jgi:2-iminobutanoate/2-iminopropanoate deaminase
MNSQWIPAVSGGSYSDAVSVGGPGRWVMVAGQVAFGPDGTVSGSMEEQANGCFDFIESALGKVGGSLSNVVRIQSFLTSLDDFEGFSRARAARFTENPPASAAVQVAGLLVGAQIEIVATAFIPGE